MTGKIKSKANKRVLKIPDTEHDNNKNIPRLYERDYRRTSS